MADILLTNGYTAIVDDQDVVLVQAHRWHGIDTGWAVYAVANVPKKRGVLLYMHRLIMGAQAGQQVDHEDHNGLNNQRSNLKLCTGSLNTARARFGVGVSGYRGVYPSVDGKKWVAKFSRRPRPFHIGTFDTKEEAARAWNEIARLHYGAFAHLNVIGEQK